MRLRLVLSLPLALVVVPAAWFALDKRASVSAGDVTVAGVAVAEPPPASQTPAESHILEGEVLRVDHEARQLEVAVVLQWAPAISSTPRNLQFATDADTRFLPDGNTLASLRPGDFVHVVALPAAGDGWRAQEVTTIDVG